MLYSEPHHLPSQLSASGCPAVPGRVRQAKPCYDAQSGPPEVSKVHRDANVMRYPIDRRTDTP
jgi:hypothetical protein